MGIGGQTADISDADDEEAADQMGADASPVARELKAYESVKWKTYCPRSREADFTILDWWRAARSQFPHLAKLVRWAYSCQASSAASERQFSKAGFINSRLR